MYYFIQYLNHLITATNQHGLHSPFVYDYVTKCIYKKTHFKLSKSETVLFKSILYFSYKRMKIAFKDSQLENLIFDTFQLKTKEEGPYDLVYFDNPKGYDSLIHPQKIHNNSIVLIANIHATKKAAAIWEALRQDKSITVSIDMFHCGLLSFRKEQVKEHFKIRI